MAKQLTNHKRGRKVVKSLPLFQIIITNSRKLRWVLSFSRVAFLILEGSKPVLFACVLKIGTLGGYFNTKNRIEALQDKPLFPSFIFKPSLGFSSKPLKMIICFYTAQITSCENLFMEEFFNLYYVDDVKSSEVKTAKNILRYGRFENSVPFHFFLFLLFCFFFFFWSDSDFEFLSFKTKYFRINKESDLENTIKIYKI